MVKNPSIRDEQLNCYLIVWVFGGIRRFIIIYAWAVW